MRVPRLPRLIGLLLLLLLGVAGLGGTTPLTAGEARGLQREHVNIVGQMVGHPDVVVQEVLARQGDRLFMSARRPGSSGFNNGWAIVDLELLPGHSAVRSFSPSALESIAGGLTAQGHLALFVQDWQPGGEGNRGSVLLYDISDPGAPQQIGRYQMARPPEISRNDIYDLVVVGNYGFIAAQSASTSPAFAFQGLITLDLSAPVQPGDDLTEVGRLSHPIGTSLGDSLHPAGARIYTASGTPGEREVHIFESAAAPSITDLGTFEAGEFTFLTPYQTHSIIGERRDPLARPVLVDLGTVGSPLESELIGDPFRATAQSGELLLAEDSQAHDLLLVLLAAIPAQGVYTIPVGSVDIIDPQGASVLSSLGDGRFALTDGGDLYLLQYDGWQPALDVEVETDGWLIDELPVAAGAVVELDTEAPHLFECAPARQSPDTDCDEVEDFIVHLILQAHCRESVLRMLQFLTLGGFNPGSMNAAYGVLGIIGQLRLACERHNSEPPTRGAQPPLPALPFTLAQGGFRLVPPDNRIELNLTIETDTARLAASNSDEFSISYAPGTQQTHIVAHAVAADPLVVTPLNPSLPPVLLAGGEAIIVTPDELITPSPARFELFVPLVQRSP